MPDEDTPDEGGLEPAAVDVVETPDATPDAPPAEAPESYTRDQLVEALGPRFAERYAGAHEGLEAFKQFGQSFDQTLGLVGRGAHLEPQDDDFYRNLGLEPPVAAEVPDEPVEPLWGAPWAEPTTMDEFDRIASERPWDALAYVDANPGKVNDDKRREVLDYWAQHDRAGAIAYETNRAEERALANAKAYADEKLAEMRAEFEPVHRGHVTATNESRNANLARLVTLAATRVPDFAEHQEGVQAMVKRYADTYGVQYFDNLLALPIEQQLDHMTEMTGAVAWRGRPAAEAQAAAEVAQTDAAKIAAGGQRGRGAASGGNGGESDLKREHRAAFERLKDIEIPVR